MKTSRMILSMASALSFVAASQCASAALTIVNGNFEDATGLGGSLPWYSGVPAGWNGNNANFSVGTDGTGLIANLEHVSNTSGGFTPLYQDIGTVETDSHITLTFDLVRPWNANPINIGVAIWPGATFAGALAVGSSYTTPGTYTLVAENVPAGTDIRIGFWRINSGSPGLDNVSISAVPVPEPSSALLGMVGAAAILASRRRA